MNPRDDIFKFIEIAEALAAQVQDNFDGITEDEPMVKLANMILPDRAKQDPEDREIYTWTE